MPLDRIADPRFVAPSKKLTVPLAADGEVVAVRVTLVKATGVVFDTVSPVELCVLAITVTAVEELVV